MKNWWSKLKPGGIMAGHDINSKWKLTKPEGDVRAALTDFGKEFNIDLYLDDIQNSFWFYKR